MARRKIKAASAERIEARQRREILDTAGKVGLPESQRDTTTLAETATAIIDGHTRPETKTIRKLTRIELLQRSGAITAHEASACSWYADRHALGFDTIGCTANYEGSSGGGFGSADLLARHKSQADARDDFTHYRGELAKTVLPAHLGIFDQIVLGQDTIGAVATKSFDLARSQAASKTRAALRLCANRLAMLISHMLPIDPAELTQAKALPQAPSPQRPAANENARVPDANRPRHVMLFLEAAIMRAATAGAAGAIRIAPATLEALQRETGCGEIYKGLPLHVDEEWTWGCMIVSADEIALAELVGTVADAGTVRGTAEA